MTIRLILATVVVVLLILGWAALEGLTSAMHIGIQEWLVR